MGQEIEWLGSDSRFFMKLLKTSAKAVVTQRLELKDHFQDGILVWLVVGRHPLHGDALVPL